MIDGEFLHILVYNGHHCEKLRLKNIFPIYVTTKCQKFHHMLTSVCYLKLMTAQLQVCQLQE